MNSVRERFAALVRAPEARIDVAEAALVIAQEEYPTLDVALYLTRLDELARAAAPSVTSRGRAVEQIDALNHFLFGEEGFAGNQDDYYDPANSYLNQVLDRKSGIPITLSLVYTEVGRRIGLPVVGVSFPGHFLVKYVGGQEEIFIDAFFATLLSPKQCLERLRNVYGPTAELDPAFFRPASNREILARMLGNLKHVYLQRRDWTRALTCCDRILLITPDAPSELRDRGALYQRLDCFSAALADFERFLQLAPDGEQADAVRAEIPDLQQAVARIN